MKIYLVGGAVRDQLLDLPVRDRDWVVVGATPQQMLEAGYLQPDPRFPVFLHPQTREEYALARTEVKTGPGYRGFRFECHPGITLEQDLQRRDLTINAMARSPQGELIDPFGGARDLHEGVLRHVSPAFVEDPLRLLRTARFAARLGRQGFHVSHGTFRLLKQMARGGELETLPAERLWVEMRDALASEQPWRFFRLIHHCGALPALMPPLAARWGEPAPAHGMEAAPADLERLRRACGRSDVIAVRLAALLWDVGAGDPWLQRLPCEREYRQLLEFAAPRRDRLTAPLEGDVASVADLLDQCRAWQRSEPFEQLLELLPAVFPQRGEALARLWQGARDAGGAVDPRQLAREGLAGRELGEAIRRQRRLAIERWLQSTRV